MDLANEKHKDKLINRDNLIGRIEVEIERILDRVNDNKPYTLLAKYMLKHFDYFFTQIFQQPEQEVLNEVYNNVFSTSQID